MNISAIRGPLLVLSGSLCFSVTGFLQALGPEGVPSVLYGELRMLVGSAFLALWCLACGRFPRRGPWPLAGLVPSVLGLALFQVTFFQGVKLAGVAVGTVVTIGITPMTTALLSWLFLRNAPPRRWYASTAIALAGLLLLNIGGMESSGPSAFVFPALAGLGYSLYFVFSKGLLEHHSPESVMLVVMVAVALLLCPVLPDDGMQKICTGRGLAVALALGLVSAALAFSLLLAGLRETDTSVAATLSLAEPMGATLLGVLVLNEPCSLTMLAGIGCIFVSVLVLIFAANPARLGKKA